MILVRPDKIKAWLSSIGKNQQWLCREMNIGKSYLSIILHNRTKMSRPVIEKLLHISNMNFETLFFMDNVADTREFFGSQIYFQDTMMPSTQYRLEIEHVLDESTKNNETKNGDEKKV